MIVTFGPVPIQSLSGVKAKKATRQRKRVAGNKCLKFSSFLLYRTAGRERRYESEYKYHADKLQTRERLQSLLVGAQSSLIPPVAFARKTVYVSIGRIK